MITHVESRIVDPGWSSHPGQEWRDSAVCAQVGLEMFYPEKGDSVRLPKLICSGCPVRRECLDTAMSTVVSGGKDVPYAMHYGIWGGVTARERRKLAQTGWRPGDPLPEIGHLQDEPTWCYACEARVRDLPAHERNVHGESEAA